MVHGMCYDLHRLSFYVTNLKNKNFRGRNFYVIIMCFYDLVFLGDYCDLWQIYAFWNPLQSHSWIMVTISMWLLYFSHLNITECYWNQWCHEGIRYNRIKLMLLWFDHCLEPLCQHKWLYFREHAISFSYHRFIEHYF